MLKVRTRGNIKGLLTRIKNFVDTVDNSVHLYQIEARHKVFSGLYDKFDAVQNELESEVDPKDLPAQEAERISFENAFFELDAKFTALFNRITGERNNLDNTTLPDPSIVLRNERGNFRLPQISLPTFDGDITEWASFLELFDAVLASSGNLDDVNKLFYLKSALKGNAFKIVESLATTGANYKEARDLLINRFGNRRCVVQGHLRGLMEQPDVKPRSLNSLRLLLDTTNKHIAALRGLKEPVQHWDTILVFTLSNKLDPETRREFELRFSTQEMPTFKDFVDFVAERCLALERIEPVKSKLLRTYVSSVDRSNARVSTDDNKRFVLSCCLCKGSHRISDCSRFLAFNPQQRYEKAKELKVCLNCLRMNHHSKECRSDPCRRCGKKHNVLLHFERNESRSVLSSTDVNSGDAATPLTSAVGLQSSITNRAQVLLYTVQVKVRRSGGDLVGCRALLDSGSQANFVSQNFVCRLSVGVEPVDVTVNGIGLISRRIDSFVDIEIFSVLPGVSLPVRAFVLPEITRELPQIPVSVSETGFLSGLQLADPECFVPGGIDLLLSNDIFTRVIRGGVLQNDTGTIKALNTDFGWIVGGSVICDFSDFVSVSLGAVLGSADLDEHLRRFWELEELPIRGVIADDPSEICFSENYKRDVDGRFVVRLPFVRSDFDFSHSENFALTRFRSLEGRLSKSLELKARYSAFIDEYLSLGFVERVPENEYWKEDAYYLPHHGVLRESSMTTKLRVVFDGTAAPAGRSSINSVLDAGSKLHNNLFVVLLRFRRHLIAFIADVEKMFCQIKINSCHRDYLRFFWRFDDDESISFLRLVSLPFGLKCSPFIAIRCLLELSKIYSSHYPRACSLISERFYVDDLLAGADSVEDAVDLIAEVKMVCELGGFNLRKWSSNSKDVLNTLEATSADYVHSFDASDEITKVLGLSWCRNSDEFFFSFKGSPQGIVTKRSILSQIAGVFDPFGWLSPIVVKGKILMQELWILKIGWDVEVPQALKSEWLELVDGLGCINKFRVHRFVGFSANSRLFGFSDASEMAYGACIYHVSGERVSLIVSKSRVAPIKTVSLARLELCGAVLCAKLMREISETMEIPLSCCYCFSDSEIVLAWLAKPGAHWKTFVANRVSVVHAVIPDCSWHRVTSKENPADIVSRGAFPSFLLDCTLWWNGPGWMLDFGPDSVEPSFFETSFDVRRIAVESYFSFPVFDELFARFSSFTKLINVFSRVRRFVSNCRIELAKRKLGPLSVEEVEESMVRLVIRIQEQSFPDSVRSLLKNIPLSGRDPLISLHPFLDDQGVLRVGGRLQNSLLPFEVKHPMILPKKHPFVDLLLRYEHFRNNHIGPNGLIAIIRQRFWILNGKTVAKSAYRKCVVCFRFKPKRSTQLLGNLPRERTEVVRPFFNVGVDLCGPFNVRPTKRRGNTTQKCFVALFVCFSTKAVHLEVVFDLTSESFIAALRRFVARRGLPSVIFSDNGTNFLGTRNHLHEWYDIINSVDFKNKIYAELLRDQVQWRFIPARTPNFGGLWESNVKSFKSSLIKCVGNEKLSFEEFQTLIIQVEATLNSRPLCITSSSNDDVDVLTPGHFLVGGNLKALPHPTFQESGRDLGSRWRHLQHIFDHYWSRWSNEYLVSLNQRKKSLKIEQNVKVGDIGLLVNESLPPYVWPLCRVVDTIKGPDGLVRVLSVKMGRSILKRGISKFCKLPDFSLD